MADKKWRLGYGNEGRILSALESGILDGSDLIITKDTKRLAFVRPEDQSVVFTKSRLEQFNDLKAAEDYIATDASAYAGELISVLSNGKYKTYRLQKSGTGYELEDFESATGSKNCVQVLDSFPESGQEEGVIYIVGTTGKIWTGSEWRVIFEDIKTVEDNLKEYVQELVANLSTSTTAPGVVDSENPLPEDYKAGQMWRVAEAGEYCGQKCEVGDLIICVADYSAETASNDDFIVVQTNIDGAVTGPESSKDDELVVFSGVSGKALKNSGINLEELKKVIASAHEHTNKTQLDSFTKTQEELLKEVQDKISDLRTEISDRLIHLEPYVTETELIANGHDIIIERIDDTKNKATYFMNGVQKTIEFPTNFKVIGGSANDNCHSSSIVLNSGDVRIISGGSLGDGNVSKTTIVVNGGHVKSILGGGYATNENTGRANHVGKATIIINHCDKQIDQIFGGGFAYASVGESEIVVNDGDVNYLTSGGSNGFTSYGNVKILGGSVQVLQTVNRGIVGSADVTVEGGVVANAYIGVEPDEGEVMTTATGSIGHATYHLYGGTVQGLYAGANNAIKDFDTTGFVSGDYYSGVLADESQAQNLGLVKSIKETVDAETVEKAKAEAIASSKEYVNTLMTLTEF